MQFRNIRGFTLIELMIVLAILAIVTVFAANSYRQYILKAHRAEGMSELLHLADRLERFYSDRVPPSYEDATLGSQNTDIYPKLTENGYYLLTIDSQDDITFTISADPDPAGGETNGKQKKDKCGKFTLTSLGEKSVSTSEPLSNCWP